MKQEKLIKPKHPCKKDCPDRHVGCATTCINWKVYEQDRAAYYAKKMKITEATSIVDSVYRMYPND